MPVYDYQCKKCQKIEEKYNSINDRSNGPVCCGEVMKKYIGNYNIVPDIEPYVDYHIGDKPVFVRSKKHRRKLMDEYGVFENYGKGWK